MAQVLAVVLSILPAAARSETGQEAFERQEYMVAAELWRSEAAQGSAQAKFGLGLIHDLGLGVPRNSAAALRWYLEAAGEGVPDAQFNVAVMFDAGTGVPRDPAAAAVWYARSAANGLPRAQYNLGMLYEAGIGVPRNQNLARAWYSKASAAIPAAADRLRQLPPADQEHPAPAPRPVTGAIVGPPDAPRAELVWTAEAGRSEFHVQLARLPASGGDVPGRGDLLIWRNVGTSAVVLDVPSTEDRLLWRVGHIAGTGAVSGWSPWQQLSGPPKPEDAQPASLGSAKRLTIYVNADDPLASSFAQELSGVFADGGVEVTVLEADRPASSTTVEYRHASDADFAASVAELLPGLQPDSAVQVPDPDTDPGEVTLRLVGGPRPSGQPAQ